MKKRLVSILLVLVMVLGMLPTMAAAADTPTEISSAEEFAAMSASGDYILKEDITITAPYGSNFSGTFDGDGHTVMLDITGTANYVGMFKNLTGAAGKTVTVKNVILAGKIDATGNNNIGGITGFVNTYYGNVRIENCKNGAAITGNKAVGGIVGASTSSTNALTVSGCANLGTITATNTQVGGIAGNLEGAHAVENCYNQGAITGFNNYAGICGRLAGTASVSHCYSTGSLTAYGTSTNAAYALVGGGTSTNVSDSYALSGVAAKLSYKEGTNCAFKTDSEMKSEDFATTLGSGFMAKSGDYPILSWETPTASKVFHITPASATLTVLKDGKAFYSGTGAEQTLALPAGAYTYTVSCAGYVTSTVAAFEVSSASADAGDQLDAVTVTLEEDASAWKTIRVTTDPSSANVTIKDGSGAVVSAEADGSYKLLATGTYTYTATTTEEGYENASGDVDLNADTFNIVLPQVTGLTIKTPATKSEYFQGDAIDTTGLVVTINYKSGDTLDVAAADFASKGITVSFSSAVVSENVNVTITYKGKSTTYTVSVEEKAMPSVLFNGLKGYATVEYSSNKENLVKSSEAFVDATLGGETVLKSNSYDKNSTTVTVTIKFGSELPTTNFVFDYKVSSETNASGTTVFDGLQINGGSKIGGEIDWTQYALSVKPGDTLTLAYSKDSSTKAGDDCVYLKNFGFAYNATIDVKTEGATVTLKNKDTGAAVSGMNGKFVVTAGTYEYTVSKFGYVTKTGEFTITDSDYTTEEITLEQAESQNVTFDLKLPEGITGGYTITIKSGSTVARTLTGETTTKLPAGDYTYTVTHPSCESADGSFTVGSSAATVTVELMRKLVFSDFFTDCEGIEATNDATYPYAAIKDGSDMYLKSTGVANYGSATITIKATESVRLSFSYYGSTYSSSYYTFTVKNGTKQLLSAYNKSSWESFSTNLVAGETLTLVYQQPYVYGGGSNDYHVKLKDFRTEKLSTVSFTNVPEGATLVLTANGSVVAPASGASYVLTEGDYTWTVSKFGFETKSESFHVGAGDGEKTFEIPALTQLPSSKITFARTPADAQVTVTHATAGAQTANDDGSFTLVNGETYSYTVSKENYITKSGSITVSGDQTITVSLTYAGVAWDGTTKTEPDKSSTGTYLISNAAELAWFADAVNGGQLSINAELTDNINLNGKAWFKVAPYDYSNETTGGGYCGTFDGANFTISGMTGSTGLFDCLGTGTIKNLHIDANLTASGVVGMFADTSYRGTIENCWASGSVTNSDTGGTGGIVGRGSKGENTIRNCANTAAIKNTCTYYSSTLNVGGLIGYTYGVVENSYSTGSVYADPAKTSNTGIGGLVGQIQNYSETGVGALKNCYAAGTVTGPANGTGAFAGTNKGVITNCYYRVDAAGKAIASGSATGLTSMTEAEMKAESFIKEVLGIEKYHVDTDGINGGYPIHAWLGGSEVVLSEDEKAVTLDVQSLKLYDEALAETIAEMREAADEEADDMIADLSLTELNNYITDNFGIEASFKTLEEAREIFHQEYYRIIEADYLEETGVSIDLNNTEGLLTPDNEGVYHIKSAARLGLAATGDNGSSIRWASDNEAISTATGAVTLPQEGTLTVKLTATAAKGDAEKSRDITVILYSAPAEASNVLDEIAEKLSARDAFVQPLQIRGHKTVQDAVAYWLYANGYKDEQIAVRFESAGTRTTSVTGNVSYIADDGAITYYQGEGGASNKQVVYSGVKVQLEKDGATKTVTMSVHIGWDIDKAQELMNKALDESLTWDKIRGTNANEAADSTVTDFSGKVVDGQVSEKLSVPNTLTVDGVTLRVGFISLPSDAVTYQYVESSNKLEISPRRPAMGKDPTTFDLQIVTLFDDNFDAYTLEAMKSRTDDATSALKLYRAFRITVAPETEETGNKISENLRDILPGMITNYYDYGAKVNLTQPVKDDLLIPNLQKMSDAGIFDYDYSQMQKFESLTPNVAELNGYHITVYRPLPGQPAATAQIKIQICERIKENGKSTPGAVLGETILTFTVEPLTQAEIDSAEALLDEVSTEDFYWNLIRGENTDKDHITKDLKPFYKIVKNADGTFSYPTLGQVKNVEGIYTDDYPGYDPMASYGETYRTFYSSRRTIIKYENLLLTQPEYNTNVTIKSWLTYEQYSKYYEKFVAEAETPNQAYDQFKTFYKREVSTTVKVDGEKNIDEPVVEPTTISVTVKVDGRGVDGFVSNLNAPYEYTGTLTTDGITVEEVMNDFFEKTDYSADSWAGYISAITDPEGHTLAGATKARPYGGWMYDLNDEYADAINEEYVEDGDEIYFYYTENYYLELDENSAEYKQYRALADDVEARIDAIPAEITAENATEYEKAVKLARNACDDLDAGVRDSFVSKEKIKKLENAERALALFKNPDGFVEVSVVIDGRGVDGFTSNTENAYEVTIEKDSTVEAVLRRFSEESGYDVNIISSAWGAYIPAITDPNGITLTAATEARPNSGWMYTLNGSTANSVDAETVEAGDEIYFYFMVDYYADESAVKDLRDMLAMIANEKDISANEESLVTSIESMYNSLSKEMQKEVTSAERKKINTAVKSLASNKKAAAKVSEMIAEKLPATPEELTLSDRSAVTKAENAYEKLTDAQKTFLTEEETARLNAFIARRDFLTENEAKIKADEKAAAAAEKKIKALPKVDKIDYTDKEEIEEARAAYEALTDDQKALVTNLETLTAAEDALKAALESVKEQETSAETVVDMINDLPETIVHDHDNKDDQKTIAAAREAYDALDKIGRGFVSKDTLKKLTTAEKALKKLVSQDTKDEKAAAKVIAKIEKLPAAEDVIVKNKSAISAARKAYDKLNENAKKYADDDAEAMQKLADCEAALNEAVLDEEAADAAEALIKKLPTAKRVKESDREKVQAAWDAYDALTEKQKTLISDKNVQKLLDCCEALGIETEEIDIEALQELQAERERAAIAIEQFVMAEDDEADEEVSEEVYDEADAE